jgi:hypothetical protein
MLWAEIKQSLYWTVISVRLFLRPQKNEEGYFHFASIHYAAPGAACSAMGGR